MVQTSIAFVSYYNKIQKIQKISSHSNNDMSQILFIKYTIFLFFSHKIQHCDL